MRCDAMIKGWLTTAMEKEIRGSVKYANTAKEIWDDLQERFGKESAPRTYEIKQAITATRQDGASVSAYYTRLRGLWDEIDSVLPSPRCECAGCKCDIGKKLVVLKDKERLYEFLMGLDSDFSVMRTQILAMSPTPSLGTAYHLVADDEQQRTIAAGKKNTVGGEAAAFQTAQSTNRSGPAQKKSTWQRVDKPGSNEKPAHCTFCGKDGHVQDGCFKKIGYPDWWPGKRKEVTKPKAAVVEGSSQIPGLTNEQYEMVLKLFGRQKEQKQGNTQPIANMAGNFNEEGDWIVDTGATEYMTHIREALENLSIHENEVPVTIPNGDYVPVKGRGELSLKGGIRIKNVPFIPNFKCNLLSVSRLTKDLHCAITFFPDFFVIQDLSTRNWIGTGKCRDGLYRMGSVQSPKAMVAVSANQWHRRLGHPSSVKMSHIGSLVNFSGSKNDFCDSCVRAKMTRLPFRLSSIKTSECFDMIHCDIWGGYRTFSLTHGNYFLTIVDDFSRAVWVYLIKRKSQASDCLINFCNLVKTQFKREVRRVRCDNGGEFVSNRMKTFYNESGIVLETTCPHTPQQNGVVERKHRHLLEIARALRFEASLPIKFWGECVMTAAYIINRLPSKVIKYKTTYEVLFKKKPSYEHMRTLGCLAYYWNTDTKGDKFAPRGKPGIFLGYPYGTKGYKVYDLEEKKMVVSRDVRFVEGIFPLSDREGNRYQGDEEILEEYRTSLWFDNEGGLRNNMSPSNLPLTDHEEENQVEVDVTNVDASGEGESSDLPFNLEGPDEVQWAEDENNVGPPQQQEQPNVENSVPRPQRARSQPARLKEFEVKLPPSVDHAHPSSNQASSTVHPLAHYLSYDKFTDNHKAFLSAITRHDEPKNFQQAAQDENWREAMRKEIQALEKNETWSLETLPEGKRAIDSKWVYKIKYKPNGEVERYKARLVAKGFTQMEGIDYHDTFAPVAKLVTIRTLLALAVKKDWAIHQLDVNNAFLHGDLEEEVYMKVPSGFSRPNETRVCKLKKSLYGLKQASRNWYHKFTNALIGLGFVQSKADYSLFTYKKGVDFVAALIYVDDVVIVGNSPSFIKRTKQELHDKFTIKDLGSLKYFLGIEVARTKEGLVLSQRKYTLDILKDSGQQGCRPSSIPMEQNLKLGSGEDEQKVDANAYRRLVGRLLYL
ncbi:putative RNA-directed DNA polymerase [Helianthus anomalus]